MAGKYFRIPLLLLFFSCGNADHPAGQTSKLINETIGKSSSLKRVADIDLPSDFERIPDKKGSYPFFLAGLPLKKNNIVYLYNGRPKQNQNAQFAVLDVSVGAQDLQQCADAVMRLRAEFLFFSEAFDQISFTDNAGKTYRFKEPFSRSSFDQYLKTVFGMCGSASLAKQLKPIKMTEMKTGDVLIRGGFPGHAVTVLAMAEKNGTKVFLLAQSYMPAQDIHILINPNDPELSPWYELNDAETIVTPEYIFKDTELKRW